jgi:thymidine kinase
MAKLYFRYGTMSSAKTLNLLAAAHTYQQQARKVVLIKPSLDDRFGKESIQSRAGLEKKADILLSKTDRLTPQEFNGIDCILVDEVQFLNPLQVEDLRAISIEANVPVICYGLRTDFKSKLFEGSKRLMELADAIEEVKTTCNFCSKKAIFNMKFINGKPSLRGPQVDLGAEEKYLAACGRCYYEKLNTQSASSQKTLSKASEATL